MDTLDKWVTHAAGGMAQDSTRFPHPTQNGAQFKMYELFISGIWLQVTERVESKTPDKGATVYSYMTHLFQHGLDDTSSRQPSKALSC